MKTQVYNLKGEKVGDIELSDKIFARDWNPDLVHQVMLAQAANRRHPWAHTKNRGEVRGGGIKPWKQKHTGRARHGSIRSPIWRGGGVTHGPRNEKNYSRTIPRGMRVKALFMALSDKVVDGKFIVLETL